MNGVEAKRRLRCGVSYCLLFSITVISVVRAAEDGKSAKKEAKPSDRFVVEFQNPFANQTLTRAEIDASGAVDYQVAADEHQEFLDKVAESQKFPWRTAVDGISARLRARQTSWAANRAVKLSADIRNLGQHRAFVIRSAMAHQVEIDGKRYRVRTGGGKSSPLDPGDIYLNIETELNKLWVSIEDGSPLELAVGKHKVRFAFEVFGSKREWPAMVSNPIEITITKALSRAEEVERQRELRARVAAADKEAQRKLQKAIEDQKKNKKPR